MGTQLKTIIADETEAKLNITHTRQKTFKIKQEVMHTQTHTH